jgi:hypothetical protein
LNDGVTDERVKTGGERERKRGNVLSIDNVRPFIAENDVDVCAEGTAIDKNRNLIKNAYRSSDKKRSNARSRGQLLEATGLIGGSTTVAQADGVAPKDSRALYVPSGFTL